VHGRPDVEVHDRQLVGERGVAHEGPAGAAAGVQRERVDRPVDGGMEPLDPRGRGEVDADRCDPRARVPPQRVGGVLDPGVLGRDHQVEAVLRELPCQLVPDPARRPGHDGQRPSGGGIHDPTSCVTSTRTSRRKGPFLSPGR